MILCCGEALIDFLPRSDPGGADLFEPRAGGSGFNTAVALGRLKAPVRFFGGLSTDMFGALLRNTLAASGVDASMAVLSDRPTTLAFVRLVDGEPHYGFFDENTAGRMLTERDLPVLPPAITALHFGGISLVQEPAASAYEALLLQEHRDRVISLDPNVRPNLIGDRDAYLARMEILVANSDIVKLSEDDLAWLAPGAPVESFAAHWLALGARLVVITRAEEGALAFNIEVKAEAPAVAVRVVDAVGAGDTFSAGLLAALYSGGQLDKLAIRSLSQEQLARRSATPPRRPASPSRASAPIRRGWRRSASRNWADRGHGVFGPCRASASSRKASPLGGEEGSWPRHS